MGHLQQVLGWLLLLHIAVLDAWPVDLNNPPIALQASDHQDNPFTSQDDQALFRKLTLESAIDELEAEMISNVVEYVSELKAQLQDDDELDTRNIVPRQDSRIDFDVAIPEDYKQKADYNLHSKTKRFYKSLRRSCNFAKITTSQFIQFLKTGRICGRRVGSMRFGLSGRK